MNNKNPINLEEKFYHLKNELRQKGLSDPTPVKALLIYGLHTSLLIGGSYAYLKSKSKPMKFLALLASTYGGLGMTTAAHTASHFTTTTNRTLDRGLTFLGFTSLLGVSERFWRNKHVVNHHLNPNNEELDGDFQLMPLFALKEDDYEKLKKNIYYKNQYYVFLLSLALNAFNVQKNSWSYGFKNIDYKNKYFYIDIICLISHFILWLILPGYLFGYKKAIKFYVFRNILLGYGMFAAFAPAHFPQEAKLFDINMKEKKFIERQVYTTINFKTGFLGWLVCNGVEFQIEHHLMPNINPLMYKKIRPYIKLFCEENNLPYYETTWLNAIYKSLLILKEPKPVYKTNDFFEI